VSSASITLNVASQRELIVVYFVINTVRKLLNTPSYCKVFGYEADDRCSNVGRGVEIFLFSIMPRTALEPT
jgi:hypothetical protein